MQITVTLTFDSYSTSQQFLTEVETAMVEREGVTIKTAGATFTPEVLLVQEFS